MFSYMYVHVHVCTVHVMLLEPLVGYIIARCARIREVERQTIHETFTLPMFTSLLSTCTESLKVQGTCIYLYILVYM